MKKFILKFILWTFILLLVIGSIVLGLGYLKYREAINKKSIDTVISEIQGNKNYTKLENISKDYLDAVVSIEDHRFYSHNGIDILSIIRSSYVNLKRKSLDYGASTITQQVGRIMYFTQEKSPIRKIAEIFVAFNLEKNYSKEEILELYVNIIYFGKGYYGIYNASQGYFNKTPDELSFEEATYLAGLPNAPSIYSVNDELGEERRLQVVEAINKYNK